MSAELLRRAADLIEERGEAASACWSAYGTDVNDTAWLDLMGPCVAIPLAAWLRQAAEQAELATQLLPNPLLAESGLYDIPVVIVAHAVELARTILGKVS